MFRGSHPLKMDAKGRLSVPARFHKPLIDKCKGRMTATISLDQPCLSVYPAPDWEALEDEVRRLPAMDPNAQKIRRLLVGNGSDCDMDSHGRILISPGLREWAGLDKQVQMVGQIQKFELWDESAWIRHREELLAQVGGELMDQPSVEMRSLTNI